MPDGGEFSWYIDSPVRKNWNYESYFIKELIPFVIQILIQLKIKMVEPFVDFRWEDLGLHFGAKHPNYFQRIFIKWSFKYQKIRRAKTNFRYCVRFVENKNIWNENDLF